MSPALQADSVPSEPLGKPLPKVLSPNTIALEVRTSMDEFWDDKVIRSVTENLFL